MKRAYVLLACRSLSPAETTHVNRVLQEIRSSDHCVDRVEFFSLAGIPDSDSMKERLYETVESGCNEIIFMGLNVPWQREISIRVSQALSEVRESFPSLDCHFAPLS